MRNPAIALLLLGAVGACHARAPRYEGPAVVGFSVSHFKKSYRYAVYEDGRAEYAESPGHGLEDAKPMPSSVTPEELRALAKTLRENDFCSLVGSDRPGVPDEASPSIHVRLGGMACSVSMWDGEFRDDPRAKASLAAVESLGKAIKARATKP